MPVYSSCLWDFKPRQSPICLRPGVQEPETWISSDLKSSFSETGDDVELIEFTDDP